MKHRFGQNVATDVESLKAASSPPNDHEAASMGLKKWPGQ
jgi:hypothetical protein